VIPFTYTRFELLRALRNVRFFVFSLVFPLMLFLLAASPNKDQTLAGVPFPVYYMTGMVAWGTMAAVIATGGRIAGERSVGWNRQLRVTPLGARDYLAAKILTGYMMALLSITTLYVAGLAEGVTLPAARWVEMTGFILVGLIPFAVLGIFLGHVLTPESIGPALGGITALFALLGGAWGPFASGGFLGSLVQLLPSYWLVRAGKIAYQGQAWPAKAWLVIGVWTLVATQLAVGAWRRDTQRA
jgi:ABC-2 type transport system permease protein